MGHVEEGTLPWEGEDGSDHIGFALGSLCKRHGAKPFAHIFLFNVPLP